MVTSNEVNYKELNKIFKFRSENEKKSFLKVISKSFDDLQSIPLAQSSNVDKWNDLNLNNQLMLKGLLLNNSKDVLTQLATLNDSTIENSIKNYKLLKRQLAKTMSQSADKRTVNIDSLKEVVNGEEAKLVKLHSTKFGETMSLGRDWKESQAKLPKNAVAIEFSNFRVTTNGKPSDSMLYVAYVYNANSEHPELVKLFEEQQLKKVLRRTSPNKLYTSNDLYQLIWNPLEKHIKGYKTFYFSPSGLLNQIQFAAILKTDASTLGTQYNIVQLSNTAILAAQPTEPSAESTLFIGGIAYDYTDAILKSSDSLEYAFLDNELLKNTNATTSRGESFTFLPGSLSEINSLRNIIKSNGKSFKVLTDKEATETNFKKLSGNSPNILHIATHGYFYENLEGGNLPNYHLSTEDQYRLAEDPLLRSGLILAGGNYTWKHGSNPYEEEDGILTAMEISNLDLSNTQMVVLSACETGLGDIDGSEGVYGLQRAFKMAGVDIIVMSLWQVPDAETAEFMNLFYGNWMKSSKVRTAFSDAQRTMQKKYADEPLKWAAFVLFE
jgi:CHAT domain-containing protein